MQHNELSAIFAQELIDAPSWQDKHRLLLRWGKLISAKPDIQKEENLVKGCETRTWIVFDEQAHDDRLIFDSESVLIRGLAALVLSEIHHLSEEQLASFDMAGLLERTGFAKRLTASRSNGLRAIILKSYELMAVPVCSRL